MKNYDTIEVSIDGELEEILDGLFPVGEEGVYVTPELDSPGTARICLQPVRTEGLLPPVSCGAVVLPCPDLEVCSDAPVAIPAVGSATDTIDVDDPFFAVTDVRVEVLISHPARAQLDLVELTSPSGTTVGFVDGISGVGRDIRVIFADDGIDYSTADLTCECFMKPAGPGDLVDFYEDDDSIDGLWELTVVDSAFAQEGTLDEWCLRFSGEMDCNDNDISDADEILDGTVDDCDGNGVPDECDPDCNDNDIPDACDIAHEDSEDIDEDGVPDECDPDCNDNGISDVVDIADGTSDDCNQDGVPDDCETPEEPEILSSPASVSVCVGDCTTLIVDATGRGETFEWLKDGVVIDGAIGNTLRFDDVTTDDEGSYEVEITDECGSVISDAAVLTVNAPPEILSSPASVSVCLGDSTTLIVDATGRAETFEWMKDGAVIDGATGNTLRIDDVTADDEGSYQVEVTDECGSVISDAAVLTVNVPPEILSLSAEVDGRTVSFSADVTGSEPFDYVWDFGDGTTSQEEPPTHTFEEEGAYTVELTVSNGCGNHSATVVIEVVPRFLRGDVDGDGNVNALRDGLRLLSYGFTGGEVPPCLDAADVNGNNDVIGSALLSDALFLFAYGFTGGTTPPDPGPTNCGRDPEDEADVTVCLVPPEACL